MPLVLLALLFCACAPHIKHIRYDMGGPGRDIQIVFAPRRAVGEHCYKAGTRLNDKGEQTGPEKIACCAERTRRVIWVSWEYVECIFHELCHLTDKSARECDAIKISPAI